jgi:hypothetical protein
VTYSITYLTGLVIGLAYAGWDHERGCWCTWQEQEPIIWGAILWPALAVVVIPYLIATLPARIGQWLAKVIP